MHCCEMLIGSVIERPSPSTRIFKFAWNNSLVKKIYYVLKFPIFASSKWFGDLEHTGGLANVSTSPTASSISSLICASLLSSSPFQNSTSPTRSCNFTSTSVCSLSTRIFASWAFVTQLVDNCDKCSSPLSRTSLPPEVVLPRVALILPWKIENGFPQNQPNSFQTTMSCR